MNILESVVTVTRDAIDKLKNAEPTVEMLVKIITLINDAKLIIDYSKRRQLTLVPLNILFAAILIFTSRQTQNQLPAFCLFAGAITSIILGVLCYVSTQQKIKNFTTIFIELSKARDQLIEQLYDLPDGTQLTISTITIKKI